MDIVGIDPGKGGAASRIKRSFLPDSNSLVPTFYPMPLDEDGEWCQFKAAALARRWFNEGVERVVIEECHAFPNISTHANAEVMLAYGIWLGALANYFTKEQLIEVRSEKWKKEMDILVPIECTCRLKEIKASLKKGKTRALMVAYNEAVAAHKLEKETAYKARKQKALHLARARCPSISFETKRGRDLDGEAEATLIAIYGSEKI